MTIQSLDQPTPTRPARRARLTAPTAPAAPATVPSPAAVPAGRWLALGRFGLGFTFLWAFVDKTFGWGYATPTARAWIHGGSPTKGFLSNVGAGPFADAFHSMAGDGLIDVLFMVGLLGIGVALLSGAALRPAAIAGTLMLVMMWAAEWPLAKTGAAGPTGSNNPFVDYHLIDAVFLIVLASLSAGRTWGVGDRWARLPIVKDHPILR
jgi:thiosulfate dehydrogenase [quinone] large subunit